MVDRVEEIKKRYSYAVDGCLCDEHPCITHEEDVAFLLDRLEVMTNELAQKQETVEGAIRAQFVLQDMMREIQVKLTLADAVVRATEISLNEPATMKTIGDLTESIVAYHAARRGT